MADGAGSRAQRGGGAADAPAPRHNGAVIDAGPPPTPLLATHDQAVAAAHAYAATIGPGAAERERAGGVPWDELRRLGRSGLAALGVPSSLGGAELGFGTIAEAVRIIAAVDPAIAQQLQPNFIFSQLLWELGSPEAAELIAQELLAGARVSNAAAERGGPHAQDLRTRLLRSSDGSLRLTGTKYYCTGAISSDWIAVTAIDDSPDERQQLVFVRAGAEGVALDDDWAAMGQRNTVSGTTVFSDVAVDPAFVLPYWQAFASPQAIGARGQLIHAAIEVGIAGGALRDAGTFLRDKSRPFFEAVRGGWADRAADDPHTIYRFGQLSTKVAAAEALLRDAGAVVDRTPTRPTDPDEAATASVAVARAKAFGSEVAVEVASELFAVAGTSATDEKYNLNRHWRNARTHSVHDPVSWKYHHIGAFDVSGTLPPNHGQL